MHDPKPNRYVPKGVDRQSWLGFENRIEQRRFVVLSATIGDALATGDVLTARAALEEARELRPDAPELVDLETRVLAAAGTVGKEFWRRAAGAVALLIVGVSMVLALDAVRRAGPGAEDAPVALVAAGAPGAPDAPGIPRVQDTPGVPGPPNALAASRVVASATIPAPAAVEPRSIGRLFASVAPALAVTPAPVAPPLQLVPKPTVAPDRASTIATTTVGSPPPVVTERTAPEPERREITAATAATVDNDSRPDVVALDAGRAASPAAPLPRDEARPARETAVNANNAHVNASLAPATPPTPPPTPPLNASAVDESRVADVLRQYVRAYGDLDAAAAQGIWPSVDQRALARAFDSLRSQQLSLQDCRIDVHGATANASCRGQAQYVGKVGSGEPRIEPRTWRFELRRDGEAWKIAHAEARRPTS